jgi:hypothetical protein
MLAYVSLHAHLRRAGGLRLLLYLDSLRRDSEDVQARYAAQLARSFCVLSCFVLPCTLAEAAFKAYWYYTAAPPLRSPWWAAAACALEVASWVYRIVLFFMVCVLFRVICYLQILRAFLSLPGTLRVDSCSRLPDPLSRPLDLQLPAAVVTSMTRTATTSSRGRSRSKTTVGPLSFSDPALARRFFPLRPLRPPLSCFLDSFRLDSIRLHLNCSDAEEKGPPSRRWRAGAGTRRQLLFLHGGWRSTGRRGSALRLPLPLSGLSRSRQHESQEDPELL